MPDICRSSLTISELSVRYNCILKFFDQSFVQLLTIMYNFVMKKFRNDIKQKSSCDASFGVIKGISKEA